LVRLLCWALVIFAIVTAVMNLGLRLNLFAPLSVIPDTTALPDRLVAIRADDAKRFVFDFIGSLGGVGVFLTAALIGIALRPFASGLGWRDIMATLFVIGGSVGVMSQVLRIGIGEAATFGYCDCGFREHELIAQDYALNVGWQIQLWFNTTALAILAGGVALAGRLVAVSNAWRTLSYVIGAAVMVAVLMIFLSEMVETIQLYDVVDYIVAAVAAILVPIWAIILARSIHKLRTWTTSVGGTPTSMAADA
jgi:hypothetical protein